MEEVKAAGIAKHERHRSE